VNAELTERPAWWTRWPFVLGALLLVALPLLWPSLPPLIDLPSHVGSYHLARSLPASATLSQWYEFHWQLLGNLGMELLVVPLSQAVGVELATKLLVILVVLLTAAGMLWIAREIHGALPPTAALALPLVYGYPLHFGFLNYCLSMALMLLAFALWLHLGRRGWIAGRALLFAAIAPVVWVAHAIGWALLAVACAGSELHRQLAGGARWPAALARAALARAALACATLATPVLLMAAMPRHGAASASGWLLLPELAKWLVTLFRDRWIAVDLATAAVFFALLAVAASGRAGLRLERRLVVPALAVFAVFVLAPQSINDSGFVNGRIAPYALALLALAITVAPGASHRHRHGVALAAAAFLVVRIASTTASLALYSASWDANLKALDHIAPGSRIVAFSPVPCGHGLANWFTPRVYHLPSLAIVRKDAFANTEWQIDGLQLLHVKYAAARPFDGDPSQTITLGCDVPGFRRYDVALATFPRQAFDMLWLLEIPRAQWPREPGLELVWADGTSALFHIPHAPPPAGH